jgi:AraC-like DNA-binding protein
MLNYDLRENVLHGNPEFPISLYTVNNEEPNIQILPCHWHEEFELIYITKGIGTFKVDTRSYILTEGELLFVNSKELHSAFSANDCYCNYYAFVFNLKFLENSTSDLCTENYIKPLLLKTKKLENIISGRKFLEKQCIEILKNIITSFAEQKPCYELFIKAQLYTLLFLFYSYNAIIDCTSEISNKPNVNLAVIKDVLRFIDHNFSQTITIEAIAGIANLSKFHFIRVFKATTSMTPTEYINMIRINEAEKCFQTTNMNITDVANFCGFNNLSYFIKTFKNYKKITPYKYKKLYSSGIIDFN